MNDATIVELAQVDEKSSAVEAPLDERHEQRHRDGRSRH
jgi:hypothetical protein